jgi:hypothetical protein
MDNLAKAHLETAKAMEARYAKNVYSKAIEKRILKTRGKGSPLACLKTMLHNNIFQKTPVTMKELIHLRKFSRTTVREEIKILSALGIIVYIGKINRAKQYALNPLFEKYGQNILSELEKIKTLDLYTIKNNRFNRTKKQVDKVLNHYAKLASAQTKKTINNEQTLDKLIKDPKLILMLQNFSSKGINPTKKDIETILQSISPEKQFNFLIEQEINMTDDVKDMLLLISFKNTKGEITKLLRYAPSNHIDYLSSVRTQPEYQHSANILDNDHKIELLKDDSKILKQYIKDCKMFALFKDHIRILLSSDFARITETIEQLKKTVFTLRASENKQDKELAEYALKLLHTQMYSGNYDIRIYVNRMLHDLYTQRPESFPMSKRTVTVTHNSAQNISIPVQSADQKAQILWSINGKKQAPIQIQKTK